MENYNTKQKLEKMRAELERVIDTGVGKGLKLDKKIIELSMDVDELINIYIKEKQEIGS